MAETSRRGFLRGLLGLTVVAVLPKLAFGIPIDRGGLPVGPWDIKAPDGTTYQWVRTALLGEPDPENVRLRLTNGWKFVTPAEQPGAPTYELGNAVENGGLVLMQKPTADVQAQLAEDRANHRFTAEWDRVQPNYPARTGYSIRGWDHLGIKTEGDFDA